MMLRRFLNLSCLAALFLLAAPGVAVACPFCNAVSQTLRQEMEVMDAVVIATAMQGDVARNKETGEVLMKVDHVLKGDELCRPGQEVKAVYYGDVTAGRRFMLSGVDPPELQWSCLPLTERSEKYVIQVTELPDDAVARLRFYIQYLQDEESMLARDAYDEFAIAPYKAVKDLGPEMDHAQLVKWIRDPEQSTDRKRLYLTMLGVCGTKKDLPMLEELMRSTQKSTRGGLDALIACYLTLAGEEGLPLVVELFLDNKNAQYADTYAAIMAIRFHGTEGDVIARSALTESLHHVLDRKDLADLVIPDLARWSDWSQIDRMTDLFINADPENNWVRVPVVNYLRACPLPAAKAALEKLEKVDPESVRRANTFFSIPVPAKDTGSSNSAKPRKSLDQFVALPIVSADDHFPQNGGSAQATASTAAATAPVARSAATLEVATANPLQLLGVLAMALATIVIAQFLLLTGGAIPEPSQA